MLVPVRFVGLALLGPVTGLEGHQNLPQRPQPEPLLRQVRRDWLDLGGASRAA